MSFIGSANPGWAEELDTRQIEAVAAEYPACLLQRLGADAPPILTALGNRDLLALPKTALFCSARCPGHVILTAYDQAAKWRDTGRCVAACARGASRLVFSDPQMAQKKPKQIQ